MGILDKLLEKKDVLAYIKFRTDILKKELYVTLESTPDKYKGLIQKQFVGRILELKELKKVVIQGTLKSKSISYSREYRKMASRPKKIGRDLCKESGMTNGYIKTEQQYCNLGDIFKDCV